MNSIVDVLKVLLDFSMPVFTFVVAFSIAVSIASKIIILIKDYTRL